MDEEWRDIPGYEGLYQVSNLGRVKSCKRIIADGRKWQEKILKPRTNSCGYNFVGLWKNSKMTEHRVHRLVAEAFISNPENKPEVNHIDGNKTNNIVKNLEWVTALENITHAIQHGLRKQHGENNCKAKLTWTDVNWIRSHYKRGSKEFGQEYLAKKFHVSQSNIGDIVNHKTWQEEEESDMTYEEDLRERLDAEIAESKRVHKFDLKVEYTRYGTVTVEAHTLEEAKEIAMELDEDKIDWNDWDTEVEADDYDWDYEGGC